LTPLFLLASCAGPQLGDGGVCGEWWLRLVKVASCEDVGPQEFLAVGHVEPVAADEQRVHIRFGNQEWIVVVGPEGKFGAWTDGDDVTVILGGRFDGDALEAELVFEPYGESCKNAYAITGQKILDYPSRRVAGPAPRLPMDAGPVG
jgi:hypothetical protein